VTTSIKLLPLSSKSFTFYHTIAILPSHNQRQLYCQKIKAKRNQYTSYRNKKNDVASLLPSELTEFSLRNNCSPFYCAIFSLKLIFLFVSAITRTFVRNNHIRVRYTCLLGAVEKLRKVTISFVMSLCPSFCLSVCLSVCPSVRPSVRMEQLGSHWLDFHEIWYLWIFRKSVENIQVALKSENNNAYFTWRTI
jgi:hypothetical protein